MKIKLDELIRMCRESSVKQVAENLKVSTRTIYYLAKGINLGGRKRSGRKKKIILE